MSMIRQGQVDLKALILWQCSKPERQIWQVALKEYRASLASRNPMGLILFYEAKASEVAELCLTLPKYCKSFDSP